MELQYIWIQDYRSISEQGFNFGGEFIFDFDYATGNLAFKKNINFIPDFFGSKISNVTAIIGKNGSGKSTFLNFIKLNIAHDIGNTNLNYICIFKEKGKFYLYNSIHNVTVKIPRELNAILENAPRGTIDGKLVSLKYPTAFMFYSPIIDFDIEDYEYTPLDLSTNYILRYTKPIKNSDHSHFENIAFKEKKKQLEFISEYHGSLPFNRPEELYMRPHEINVETLLNDLSEETKLLSNLKYWQSIIVEEKKKTSDQSTKLSKTQIYEAMFWHLVNTTQVKKSFLDETIKVPFLNRRIPYKPISDSPTFEIVEQLFKSATKENEYLISYAEFIEFSSALDNLSTDGAMYYFFARFNLTSRSDEDSEKKFASINKFLKAYYEISKIGDFLAIDFGLSSGENAWLTLFSRLYGGRKRISEYIANINESRTLSHKMDTFTDDPEVVILIDEGETSFHPEWQRKFLSTLCDFLPEVLNVPRVQLVLASNSPFLVSDLPKTNIQFVELKDNKTKVIEREMSSFGANIHDLLARDFFLDIPIGEFAEKKISSAISQLNNSNDNNYLDHTETLKLINIIDDPFVRDKMLQMYALKFESENWEEGMLELQKQYIEAQLKKIRNKKDVKNQ